MNNPLHSLTLRYRLTFPLLSVLPYSLAYRLASLHGGWQSSHNIIEKAMIADRKMTALQMQRVFGDDAPIEQWVDYYTRLVDRETLDTWFFSHMRPQQIKRLVSVEGFDSLQQARQEGRKVMVFSGHFNRFWMVGMALNAYGITMGALARDGNEDNMRFLPPAEQDYRRLKMQHYERGFGGPMLLTGEYLRNIYRALDQHVIAMLIDIPYADPQKFCVPMPFLGKTGYFPNGIARVAKRRDVLIYPYYIEESRQGLNIKFLEPIETRQLDEAEIMQIIVAMLQQFILDNPEQWWLWHALPMLWNES